METTDYNQAAYLVYRGIPMLEPRKVEAHPGKLKTYFVFPEGEATTQAERDWFLSEAKAVSDITKNVIIPITRHK